MVKEGYLFSAPLLFVGLVLVGLKYTFLRNSTWPSWLAGLCFFLAVFVLYFFRDPERLIPEDPSAVVSPADGRVVDIVDESWEGRSGKRISIFLAVWNVHVQRAPVAGTIRRLDYRPGKFFAAMRARASVENEQNVFTMATPRGEIMFKQIAGWIARRVVSWKAAGDVVSRGERVGMIRFGSRVDVWLPADAVIVVHKGQNVAGGSDILARWP
jgi:phosphatidylserine decarboxylase